MEMTRQTFKDAMKNIVVHTYQNSKKTILFMLKIIIPITFIVMLLQYLHWIQYITVVFEPLMTLFGLSGDAALVLITSNLINVYGGLAVMTTMSFTVKEVTILAVMILFSHALIVECAIMKGLKVPIRRQLVIRIGAGVLSGIVLNLLIGSRYGEVAYDTVKPDTDIPAFSMQSFDVFSHWTSSLLTEYALTILDTTFTLVWIITLVLFGLEVLKEFNVLDKLNHLLYKGAKYLGISKSATSSLLIGIFIGITYGAGAILIHYKEGRMSQKDVTLVTTFLMLSHAIVEDVFLFIKLGAVPWILIGYKVTFAIIATYLYNIWLNHKQKKEASLELESAE